MYSLSVPGRYVSYWRLCAPEGQRFGHRVWVDIQVSADKVISLEKPVEPIPVEPIPAEPQPVEPLPVSTTEQLELEFEHMNMSVPPQPLQTIQIEPIQLTLPEPIETEIVAPTPVLPEAPFEPVPEPEVYMSPQEIESIQTLQGMGFQGDLIGVLRRNNGDLLAAVGELLGN